MGSHHQIDRAHVRDLAKGEIHLRTRWLFQAEITGFGHDTHDPILTAAGDQAARKHRAQAFGVGPEHLGQGLVDHHHPMVGRGLSPVILSWSSVTVLEGPAGQEPQPEGVPIAFVDDAHQGGARLRRPPRPNGLLWCAKSASRSCRQRGERR